MTRHLLDALITATSDVSFPERKTGFLEPGDMGVASNGKAFLVTASRLTKTGASYKVSFEDGTSIPLEGEGVMSFEDMGDTNSPMGRVAAMRLAMNPDFDLYVKTSITDHDLPVDEDMNWAKWLESTYRTMVAPTNEEVRDEAIHHMLIENLFRYDALARFDASRLPASIQKLPLAKQVSSYLKGYFLQQRSDCVEWIKKTYGTGKEMLILDDAEGSENFINNPEYSEEDTGFSGSISKIDTEKFRKAFLNFLENSAGITHRKTKEKVIMLFNLILDTPASKPGEIIEKLAEAAQVSHSTATKLFFTTLPALIEKFMKTPEGASLNTSKAPSEAKQSNLEDSSMRKSRLTAGKRADAPAKCSECGQNLVNGFCPTCKNKADKAIKEQAKAMAPKEEPKGPQVKSYGSTTTASNKAARTEGTPTAWEIDNERVMPTKDGEPEGSKIKVEASMDKYATFRHVAEEEPQALSEALVELSDAFSTLAEASEALVENLDLAPVNEEGSLKEKVASRKKFASALRRLAADQPEAVEDAVKELYSSLDEIAAAMENLASNLGIDLVDEESEMDEEIHDELEESNELSEVENDSLDTEVPEDVNIDGADAPALLDEFGSDNKADNKEASLKERILARRAARKQASKVVCNTESGGVWTKYEGSENLVGVTDGTNWKADLFLPEAYVLSEGPESFAIYTHGKILDVDSKETDFFNDELAELKNCLGQ